MTRRVAVTLTALLLLASAGGAVGWRWWHNRPPYGPAALHARATLQLVDQATADAALEPVNAVVAGAGDQIFLGRVSWTPPPEPAEGNVFRIVVLDRRNHLLPGYIAVTSPRPDDVSSGWDSTLDVAQRRHPWLQGAGLRASEGKLWSPGSVILVGSVEAAPVTFQIVLRPARPGTPPEPRTATAPLAVEDLLVALISVGSDGQVYWAHRLLN